MITLLLIFLLIFFGEKGWLFLWILLFAAFALLGVLLFVFLRWELTNDHKYHERFFKK